MTWKDILKQDVISFAQNWVKTAPDTELKTAIENYLDMLDNRPPAFRSFIEGYIKSAFDKAGIEYR